MQLLLGIMHCLVDCCTQFCQLASAVSPTTAFWWMADQGEKVLPGALAEDPNCSNILWGLFK